MDTAGTSGRRFSLTLGGFVFSFAPSELPGGNDFRHRHAGYELFFSEDASYLLSLEGSFRQIPAGSCLLLPPGLPHALLPEQETEQPLMPTRLQFTFSAGNSAAEDPALCHEVTSLTRYLRSLHEPCTLPGNEPLIRSLRALVHAWERTAPSGALALQANATGLIQSLFSALLPAPEADSRRALSDVTTERIAAVRRFFDFSEERNSERTPAALSRELSLSARHTARLLQELFGKSFSELLLDARMNAANRLLADTNRSIEEIADRLGFPDETVFVLTYRHYHRISPADFRRSWQTK